MKNLQAIIAELIKDQYLLSEEALRSMVGVAFSAGRLSSVVDTTQEERENREKTLVEQQINLIQYWKQ